MANDTILTPGGDFREQTPMQENSQYLEKDKFLSEYETESEKAVVRENLDVYAKDLIYTKQESDIKLDETIKKAFEKYLNEEDPHGLLPTVEQMIEGFVKSNGSVPFTAPQIGVDPIQDFHLATKRFVTKLIKDHLNSEDPHNILPEVKSILQDYVKQSEVYLKKQLYTKNEIDEQSGQYIKKDGTTPFTKAQIGADPQIDSHLTTKRYVDKVLYNHLIDVDPHGFISILNNRLSSYIKKKDVYDKTQTYSRTQLDSIINSLVNIAISSSIQEYIDSINDKFEYIRKQNYIKQDGSIPFRNPQRGVDAVNDLDLVTLQQLTEIVETSKSELNKKIDNKECEWKTSGPTLTEVGLVEKGNVFANTVSLQEVMDAIFYGKGISITASELVKIGNTSEVTICVQGSLASLEYGELYQNGELIYTFTRGELEEQNCITVESNPIKNDTEFIFKAFYINGSVHEVNAFTKLSMPVFVGILPKWKFGNTVTYDYLMQLYFEDNTNNKFYDRGNKLARLDHIYQFSGKELKHLFLALPADYPDLYQIVTPSQQFGTEAFDIIDMIPFQVPGADKDVIYKLYIYRQAIVQLNNPVTFNFMTDHEQVQ